MEKGGDFRTSCLRGVYPIVGRSNAEVNYFLETLSIDWLVGHRPIWHKQTIGTLWEVFDDCRDWGGNGRRYRNRLRKVLIETVFEAKDKKT